MADVWFRQFLPDLSKLAVAQPRVQQSVEDITAILQVGGWVGGGSVRWRLRSWRSRQQAQRAPCLCRCPRPPRPRSSPLPGVAPQDAERLSRARQAQRDEFDNELMEDAELEDALDDQ